jgi:rare lipoprotein A
MNKIFIVFCVAATLFLTACHRISISSKATKNCEETGMASFYGGKYIGRPTANGEIFVANKLTAAHKTLPFGTMVKVTNLSNNKSVIVRINDRGPFVKGRIIDLSELAAKKIDMMQQGTVKVTILCTK